MRAREASRNRKSRVVMSHKDTADFPSRKCVKSAVFGDVDTTWETLFYANSGASNQTAGDHVSLYLSCVVSAFLSENRWS